MATMVVLLGQLLWQRGWKETNLCRNFTCKGTLLEMKEFVLSCLGYLHTKISTALETFGLHQLSSTYYILSDFHSYRLGKLTALDLGNNSISARGAFYVAEYIKKSKSLVWISLYMNDIGDEGAEKIAKALKQNRSITNVDLGGNDIHAEGVSEIAQVLKDNSVIAALELGYNPIRPDGAKALAEVLKFHGNVKDLNLGWCQVTNGMGYSETFLLDDFFEPV